MQAVVLSHRSSLRWVAFILRHGSREWFQSTELWLMVPARFHCTPQKHRKGLVTGMSNKRSNVCGLKWFLLTGWYIIIPLLVSSPWRFLFSNSLHYYTQFMVLLSMFDTDQQIVIRECTWIHHQYKGSHNCIRNPWFDNMFYGFYLPTFTGDLHLFLYQQGMPSLCVTLWLNISTYAQTCNLTYLKNNYMYYLHFLILAATPMRSV